MGMSRSYGSITAEEGVVSNAQKTEGGILLISCSNSTHCVCGGQNGLVDSKKAVNETI